MALPMISADGRWNTHAIVGVAGPLAAERRLSVRAATAWSSAASWTIVVNRFPDHRQVAAVGSRDGRRDEEWRSLDVPPGSYLLVLRYYGWGSRVELPEVRVDDAPRVAAREVPGETNAFYQRLPERSHPFYKCLHFYVYAMLRYARLLPRSWVERELLPLGNPETRFYYGCVDPGQAVSIEVDEESTRRANVYYTLYDLQSFPLEWCQVSAPRHRGSPAPGRGFYLVRVQPLDLSPAGSAGVTVSVVPS
jgi:hypothetical protein